MAKIVESVVQRQRLAYISHNHLLSTSQYGFRSQNSTETALLSVTNRIFSNMDCGHISLLCLLGLSKCFDVIPHSPLLSKLQLYNIDPTWFSAYLSGHTQSVSISTPSRIRVVSKPLPNTMEIFQGSSLGPLLFTIFASDLSLHAPDAHVIQCSTLTTPKSYCPTPNTVSHPSSNAWRPLSPPLRLGSMPTVSNSTLLKPNSFSFEQNKMPAASHLSAYGSVERPFRRARLLTRA